MNNKNKQEQQDVDAIYASLLAGAQQRLEKRQHELQLPSQPPPPVQTAPQLHTQPQSGLQLQSRAHTYTAPQSVSQPRPAAPQNYPRPQEKQRTKPPPFPGVTRKKRVPVFYKTLLVFVVLMTICICIGAYFFWGYLAAYEASLPEHIISELLDNIDYDFWEQQVKNTLTPMLTEFERDNTAAVLEPYLSMTRDVTYTIRQKRDESTDKSMTYILRAGARDIGVIRLVSLRDAGYGFTLWDIESIDFLESFTDGFAGSMRITVSQNARVDINGIAVQDSYAVPCDEEFGKTYQINNIFGEAEITVTEWDGQISAPYYVQGGEYIYAVLRPFSRSFDIVAPSSVAVYIDDERLTDADITDGRIISSIFDGIIDPSQVPVYSVRYQPERDGFYAEPTVKAVNTQGNELPSIVSDTGQIIYKPEYSDEYKELYASTAEDFIRAYIKYTANIGANAQANFDELSNYMVRGSELYNRARTSLSEAVIWAGGSSVTYNMLEIDNFLPYGDKYFTCEIRYNLSNQTYYESREVTGNFETLFELSGGKWLAVKMISMG